MNKKITMRKAFTFLIAFLLLNPLFAHAYSLSQQILESVDAKNGSWMIFSYDKDMNPFSFEPNKYEVQEDGSLVVPYLYKTRWSWGKAPVRWIRFSCVDNDIYDLGAYKDGKFETNILSSGVDAGFSLKTFYCPIETDKGKKILSIATQKTADGKSFQLLGFFPDELVISKDEHNVEFPSYLYGFKDYKIVSTISKFYQVDCVKKTIQDSHSYKPIDTTREDGLEFRSAVNTVCQADSILKMTGFTYDRKQGSINKKVFDEEQSKIAKIESLVPKKEFVDAVSESEKKADTASQTSTTRSEGGYESKANIKSTYALGLSVEERDNVIKVVELSPRYKTTLHVNDVLLNGRSGLYKIKLNSVEDFDKYISSQKKNDVIQFAVLRDGEEIVGSVKVQPLEQTASKPSSQTLSVENKIPSPIAKIENNVNLDMSFEKKTCADLGFKPKSQAFGNCVLKLHNKPKEKLEEQSNVIANTEIIPKGDGSNDDGICQKYGFKVGDESYKKCRLELKIAQDRADDQLRQYELQKQAYDEQVRQYQQQNRIREAAIEEQRLAKERQDNINLLTFGLGIATGRTFYEAAPALSGQPMRQREYPQIIPPPQPTFDNFQLVTPYGRSNCSYNSMSRQMNCR